MECNVEGEVDKLREVANAAREGVDYAVTDIEGAEGVSVKLIKAVHTVEEEVDLNEEETPQI